MDTTTLESKKETYFKVPDICFVLSRPVRHLKWKYSLLPISPRSLLATALSGIQMLCFKFPATFRICRVPFYLRMEGQAKGKKGMHLDHAAYQSTSKLLYNASGGLLLGSLKSPFILLVEILPTTGYQM